jgi:hypothetical protein
MSLKTVAFFLLFVVFTFGNKVSCFLVSSNFFLIYSLANIIVCHACCFCVELICALRSQLFYRHISVIWFIELNWTELNWTELNWTELNWTELNWTELNWTELNWTELNWTELGWTELNWTELNWTELNWTELNWTELNWTGRDLGWVEIFN